MIDWRLKQQLAKANIHNASQLHKKLIQELGMDISIQGLSKLINKNPSVIKLETVQILCNLLECNLSDILIVEPDSPNSISNKPFKPYKKKAFELQENICFTDPRGFIN